MARVGTPPIEKAHTIVKSDTPVDDFTWVMLSTTGTLMVLQRNGVVQNVADIMGRRERNRDRRVSAEVYEGPERRVSDRAPGVSTRRGILPADIWLPVGKCTAILTSSTAEIRWVA